MLDVIGSTLNGKDTEMVSSIPLIQQNHYPAEQMVVESF
jgi:hypothetical protein